MSGGCEKKIIYVGKSENLLSRLIEHFCAMSALKKNIIERVCEKAHENIYCYMNPYLWHEDVEVVLIVDEPQLQGQRILTVNNVVDYIEQELKSNPNDDLRKKLDNLKTLEKLKDEVEGYLKTLGKLDNLEIEKLKAKLYEELEEILKNSYDLKKLLKNKLKGDLKTLKGVLIDLILEILEKILIDLTQPYLNDKYKSSKENETLKNLKQKFKSYLCDYGLSIEELVEKKEKLKSVGGCYIIKHSILPEELTCCIRTIRTMLFRKNTSKLFRKLCCNNYSE